MWGAGGGDHPGVCASALDGQSRTRQRLWKPGPLRNRRSSIHPSGGVDNKATFTTFSLLPLLSSKVGQFAWVSQPPRLLLDAHDALRNLHRTGGPGIASGIGADSASAASCRTRVIHVDPIMFYNPPNNLLSLFPSHLVRWLWRSDWMIHLTFYYHLKWDRIVGEPQHRLTDYGLLKISKMKRKTDGTPDLMLSPRAGSVWPPCYLAC